VARWPARVKAASTCADPVMLCDFMATCADVLGAKLPDDAAVDSVSILPDLLQTAKSPMHEALVHHSIGGRFSIRQGNWKLELCPGSGGWAAPRDPAAAKAGLPLAQLYDLASDVSETTNLIKEHPEVAQRLTALLEKYVNDGRSTPGPKQRNDVVVDIFKSESSRP
jgi:arylsulfatase A-like enzyme